MSPPNSDENEGRPATKNFKMENENLKRKVQNLEDKILQTSDIKDELIRKLEK